MKNQNIIFFLGMCVAFLSGCNRGAQPIDYGNDGCHFCKMTIVDKIHGAELVTKKGKVFKFDATECLIEYLNDHPEETEGSYLTNHFEKPTELISVHEAIFLISKNLPSPMGGNLTAFHNKETAEKILSEKGGKLYSWVELKSQFNH